MKNFVLAMIVLAGSFCFAQNCDSIIADETHSTNVESNSQVSSAAQKLISEGADVRVRVIGRTSNADGMEAQYEKNCSSWQSSNGVRKTTLIVLMVSPESRKMGMYYGSAWHKALDDHWNRIKQEYMTPYFKNGDWAGGFAAAETQLAARLAASKDEAVHPAQTVVNQTPTDLSGLWRVFGWLVGLFALTGLIVLIFRLFAEGSKTKKAQRDAIALRDAAAFVINNPGSGMANQAAFDAASERFSQLANTVSGDPTTVGLSRADYESLGEQYARIYRQLYRAKAISPQEENKQPSGCTCTETNWMDGKGHDPGCPLWTPPKAKHHHAHSSERVVERTTVVQQPSSNDGLLTGYVIGNALGRSEGRSEEEHEERHSHHHSDDSGGGGSSDWGSSSSSSSDFGGGGSSDFGSFSGGDSGGGGSSDF